MRVLLLGGSFDSAIRLGGRGYGASNRGLWG